jgi:ADP-ribose pyrophosphatase
MDFEEIKREVSYQGRAFDVHRVHLKFPDSHTREYDLVIHPGAVVIVPLDEEGNLLFVRQYRLGASQELLELPAGVLEEGETPETTARREIREETGMAAHQWTKLGEMYIAPGYCTEHQVVFLARGLSSAPLKADSDEYLNLQRIPLEEAYRMARNGSIHDAKTLAALLLAEKYLRDG